MKSKSFFKRLTLVGFYVFVIGLPFTLIVPQFGIALAVLGWLGEGVVHKNWQIKWHPLFLPLLLYLLWNLVAAAASPRSIHSLAAVADNEWLLLMMLMMYWCLDDLQDLKRIVASFLVASVLPLFYALVQMVAGVEYYSDRALDPLYGYYRAVGFHGFYLTFAAFAMIILLLSSSFWFETAKRMKWGYAGLAVLSFLAVLATFARSMWLSFLVVVPIFGFLRRRKTGLLLTAAMLVLITLSVFSVPGIRTRIQSIADPTQSETRLNLWKTSVAIAKDHPYLGTGQDNFDYFFPKFKVAGFYDADVHPHNDYLSVLVASGIPGLTFFLGMWWIVLRTGFKVFRLARTPAIRAIVSGASLSIVSLLVGSFFQNYYGTFLNCMEWWFLVGLILSCARLEGEGESLKAQPGV